MCDIIFIKSIRQPYITSPTTPTTYLIIPTTTLHSNLHPSFYPITLRKPTYIHYKHLNNPLLSPIAFYEPPPPPLDIPLHYTPRTLYNVHCTFQHTLPRR